MHRFIALLLVAAALASCSRKEASTPPPAQATETRGPVTWDATSKTFQLAGQPLPVAKLWTFDGSTEGFISPGGGKVAPAPGAGLDWPVTSPMLRSPTNLNIDGARYPLVMVRLTRIRAGELWDAALYYKTEKHDESGQFFGKPLNNKSPAVNETVTLVYDMSRQPMGGPDWTTSTINSIRLDIEDKPGGRFIIHQVAIAENPNPAALAPPPKAAAPTPAPAPKGG